jgi:glycosyltransferase involved in cell wall biosynthesis
LHLGANQSRRISHRYGVRRDRAADDGASTYGSAVTDVRDHRSCRDGMRRELSARFLLVGDGPMRAQPEDTVAQKRLRGRVSFAGSQEDVWRYLRAFDIAVLASESEGFSNSGLEYVAMGLLSVVGMLEETERRWVMAVT